MEQLTLLTIALYAFPVFTLLWGAAFFLELKFRKNISIKIIKTVLSIILLTLAIIELYYELLLAKNYISTLFVISVLAVNIPFSIFDIWKHSKSNRGQRGQND